jgi:hypothetical protein
MWPESALRTSGFPIENVVAFGTRVLWEEGADRTSYRDALEANRVALERVVTDDRFRRALLWQNPSVIDSAVAWLARRHSDKPPSGKILRGENLLVQYAQRYHAKNESVGFFGPVGWAAWAGATHDPLSGSAWVSGAAGELGPCRIQVEHRVVAHLARAFAEEPALRRAICPSRAPGITIHAGQVRTPVLGTFVLPDDKHQVLAACDGRRTLGEIEDDVQASIGREVDVERVLVGLERAGLVSRDLRVPPTPFPESWLRRYLASLPADTAAAEAVLDELDRAKLAAASATDEAAVRAALSRPRAVLESVTKGSAPWIDESPHAQAVLVHERTCSLRLAVGPEPLAELVSPLECLLVASRWLTWQVSEHFTARLTELLDRDADHRGRLPGLVAAQYFAGLQGEPFRTETAGILAEFRRRWSAVVPAPDTCSHIRYDPAEIRERAATAFAAPLVDWISGRYHSPDVMLAAKDMEGIAAGQYEWILGELHVGQNTIEHWIFVTAHAQPERLADLLERDSAGRRWVLPQYPSGTPDVSSRSYPSPVQISPWFDHLRLVSGEAPRDGVPPDRIIEVADVWLARSDEGPVVVEHQDGRRWTPMEMFGEILGNGLVNTFRPYAPVAHRPRVTIGRLTVAREQWRFSLDDVKWRDQDDEFERHQAATAWAQGAGLPQFIFVKCGGESKPFYVDLASPLLVTMFARLLRRQAGRFPGSDVVVSEMYPTPSELWAPFDENRRSTSEIRMAFFDLGPAQ